MHAQVGVYSTVMALYQVGVLLHSYGPLSSRGFITQLWPFIK